MDYTNINENPFFRFYMQKLGLKEYNRYVHLSACIEIVQTFYANLEPALANQLAHTIVGGKIFLFTREEILKALPTLDIHEIGPSFSNRVNASP